jgi:competence ComEA-like helix-hairpin-helix protein
VITDPSDLLDLESIDEQMIQTWDENIGDMRVDINEADEDTLKKIKGIGAKLAKIILDFKEKVETFTDLDQLKDIEGIGKSKFTQLKSRLKIGE